jgi:hypothetical protein
MNRHQLFESSVSHNVGKRVYLGGSLGSGTFLLYTVSEQMIILRPELLLRGEERSVVGVIGLLVWQVFVQLFFFKN